VHSPYQLTELTNSSEETYECHQNTEHTFKVLSLDGENRRVRRFRHTGGVLSPQPREDTRHRQCVLPLLATSNRWSVQLWNRVEILRRLGAAATEESLQNVPVETAPEAVQLAR
jgi:hypothetical protein